MCTLSVHCLQCVPCFCILYSVYSVCALLPMCSLSVHCLLLALFTACTLPVCIVCSVYPVCIVCSVYPGCVLFTAFTLSVHCLRCVTCLYTVHCYSVCVVFTDCTMFAYCSQYAPSPDIVYINITHVTLCQVICVINIAILLWMLLTSIPVTRDTIGR